MNADSKAEPSADLKEDVGEPLKRFTKEDLKKHRAAHPSKETQQASVPSSNGVAPAKVSLVAVLEPDRNVKKLDQPFPRSFAKAPCKPNVDPQPKTKILAVALVVVFFVGLGIYLLIQRHLDKSKPHVPPKNMPMRVIEGVMRP